MPAKPKADLRAMARKSAPAAAARPAPEGETAPAAPAATPPVRPDRVNRRNVTAYVTRETKRILKDIGNEREMTIQEMLVEALNDYFAKHGRPEIAS